MSQGHGRRIGRCRGFPSVRRDVAVIVSRDISAAALLDAVRKAAPATLREAFVFDIYTGQQIGATEKSVAIGLILQDTSRTLTDEDADGILQSSQSGPRPRVSGQNQRIGPGKSQRKQVRPWL